MAKSSLKHMEFEFGALVGAVTEIKPKQPAKFYLSWKITHENEGVEIIGDQYVQPNKIGVLSFST